MTDAEICMVLNCTARADEVWCSHSGHRGWIVEWNVCPHHCAALVAGERWAPEYETVPRWRRWLLMGEALESEVTAERRWIRDQAGRAPTPIG